VNNWEAEQTGGLRGETELLQLLYNGKEIYYDRDDLQFDQYTGQLLNITHAARKSRGQQLLEMNYDIHVGAIGGLPGKIIAFIISLICASLPVTGFYIWWEKRKKNKLTK
jgi:uncharacterized iron-regulated membrane protein